MKFPLPNIKSVLLVGSFLFGFLLLDSYYLNFIISGDNKRQWQVSSPARWTLTDPNVTDRAGNVTEPPQVRTGLTKPVSQSPPDASKYILNTDLCKIPRTPIMPAYFKKNWRVDKVPDCDYEKDIAKVMDDGVLELLPEYQHSNCCLHEIRRNPGTDKGYNLTDCEPVEVDTNTADKEMYVLRCNNSFKFEANMPVHAAVQDKRAYWKTQDPDSRPFNVIFFGIDTVSRSHAFRSLPKTMGLLQEMGFHDFVGYHSIAPSTLSNFMGFLIGLRRTDVRNACWANWSTPVDECPFIWKDYSQQNYVTMYLEDGIQTFNWGGQSGFLEKPADYYLHSFFNAVEDLRLKNFPFEKTDELTNLHAYCTSRETVPQFSNRYLKRFIRKFQRTPFFAFSWYAYPFHDSVYALGNFDYQLLSFFQYIQSSPAILRNSLIIFNADHGPREQDKFFESMGIEAYIERGLPPLFIRVPERLLEKYPEMDLNQVMRRNTQELVSPFDLHHTLLHLLDLGVVNNGTSNFEPVLQDRSSLFVPIAETNVTRTCSNLHLNLDTCVCNTLPDVEPIQNPYLLGKVAKVLQARLRDLVKRSGYKKVCAEWTVSTADIFSAQVVAREDRSTINRIQFDAWPGGAKFEAKVRIVQKKSNFDSCEIMGSLNRINQYGNQSSCVGSKTDSDKEMKAFCKCK